MDENEKSQWGRAEFGSLLEKWPKGADGEPEEPVRLCTCMSVDMSDELKINMLEAYGIPCLKAYPGDGGLEQAHADAVCGHDAGGLLGEAAAVTKMLGRFAMKKEL